MKPVKVFYKWLSTLIWLFLIVIIIVFTYISMSARLSPDGFSSLGQYQMMEVLSGSMNPTFDAGSLILVQKVKPDRLEVGDIITYREDYDTKKNITHRIIKINRENDQLTFTTKGDANQSKDPSPVLAKSIVGEVKLWVPKAGYATKFVKTKLGIFLLVVLPGAFLIISELWKLIKLLAEDEKSKKEMEV